MFAVYATHAAPDDPLSALKVGERPEPDVPAGWVRVKVSHASLNRHDLFTLRGLSGHPEGIRYPIILGNDAAGSLDDGTPVVLYPVMGGEDWRGDETLDPRWHIPSEFIHGTFADYAVVPQRNAIPLPKDLSPLHASVLGTAWLTAYRALFTKSGLRAGETLLVQGATGGMATALIQLGRAAGFEVWVTSRSEEGQARARALGAHQSFPSNRALPRKVRAVIDNVGSDSWAHMGDPAANPMGVEWFGLSMGLGFVLAFGYWCTDFLVVQRAMAAKGVVPAGGDSAVSSSASAARAAPGWRPAASAWAREQMAPRSARTGVPLSSCATSSGSACTAARSVSRIGGERVSVLSSTRFNRFSTDHANSPSSRAPTMRPLPLNVWKQRRTVTSESRSSGFWSTTSGFSTWISIGPR